MADAARLAAIPLHCSICPKGPRFSDPSHLLTHVASKGHLSNHFKVSVRTSTDPAARAKLDAYSRWYERYGIEQLLSQRMKKKDAKNARLEPKRQPVEAGPPRRSVKHGPSGHDVHPSRHALDTDLCHVEGRSDPAHVCRHHVGCASARVSTAEQRPCSPPTHPWAGQARSSIMPKREDMTNFLPETPRLPVPSHGFAPAGTDAYLDADYPLPTAEDDDLDVEYLGAAKKGGGEAQLKGVCWPGMAIFDSATPEMKKKRNQKKDASLALQLELSSTRVEATEQTFDSDGALRIERPISRLLDDSPSKCGLLDEDLVWTRGVLAEADVNRDPLYGRAGPVGLTSKSCAAASSSSYDQHMSKRVRHGVEGDATMLPSVRGGVPYDPTSDDERAYKLTLTGSANKRKRSIAVYEDISPSKPERHVKAARPLARDDFGSPCGFTYLNSGHAVPTLKSALGADRDAVQHHLRPSGECPKGLSGDTGRSHTGKENLPVQKVGMGQLDSAGWVPMPPRRDGLQLDGTSLADHPAAAATPGGFESLADVGSFDYARDVEAFTFDAASHGGLSLGNDTWAADATGQQTAGGVGDLLAESHQFWGTIDDGGVGRINFDHIDGGHEGGPAG